LFALPFSYISLPTGHHRGIPAAVDIDFISIRKNPIGQDHFFIKNNITFIVIVVEIL
jgi:hypothetical protein